MAKKLFETNVKEFKEDEITVTEKIYIFEFEDNEESEDFELYSHSEQLAELGFKERSTPLTEHGTVQRYSIDFTNFYIIVIETITKW